MIGGYGGEVLSEEDLLGYHFLLGGLCMVFLFQDLKVYI